MAFEDAPAVMRDKQRVEVPALEHGALIGLVTMDNVGEFRMVHAADKRPGTR